MNINLDDDTASPGCEQPQEHLQDRCIIDSAEGHFDELSRMRPKAGRHL